MLILFTENPVYMQEFDGIIDHRWWLNNYIYKGLDFLFFFFFFISQFTPLWIFGIKQSKLLCATKISGSMALEHDVQLKVQLTLAWKMKKSFNWLSFMQMETYFANR